MTLVKIALMAVMLSSSIAMASKTCTIRGPDGQSYTGHGESIVKAQLNAGKKCGEAVIESSDDAGNEDSLEVALLCVNKECE